jgi:hypothetical protein
MTHQKLPLRSDGTPAAPYPKGSRYDLEDAAKRAGKVIPKPQLLQYPIPPANYVKLPYPIKEVMAAKARRAIKEASANSTASRPDSAQLEAGTNILHNYRSFNYVFTMAAMWINAFDSPANIRASVNNFVVAKSSGKRKNAINPNSVDQAKSEPGAKGTVEEFNEKSPGRFDFSMNNLEIETLMAFSNQTNLAMATQIKFEIFEPLSINGFMEAMQVAALAAGYTDYISCPFVLKMEFIGYPDSETGPSDAPEKVPNSTRHFVIKIAKIEVDMTEAGTKYRCTAFAHNEFAYGSHNVLKNSVQMKGANVGEILGSLVSHLNTSAKQAVKIEQGIKDEADVVKNDLADQYEIIFPTPDDDGKYNYEKPYEYIMKQQIKQLDEAPGIYSFSFPGTVKDAYQGSLEPDSRKNAGRPGYDEAGTKINPDGTPGNSGPAVTSSQNISGKQAALPSFTYNKFTSQSVMFSQGAKIHDIIAAVIRDSDFGRKIVQDPKTAIKNQMVQYVHIAAEVIIKNRQNPKTGRPVYLYRYIVLPYNMHFTRVPMFQKFLNDVDQKDLERFPRRKYSYIYTGQNVDIKSFNLRFNNLFYQAYPAGLGNNGLFTTNPNSGAPAGAQLKPTGASISGAGRYSQPKDVVKPGGNAGKPNYFTYDALVGNMHQAILDNLDMVSCEIEILGDPFFLVTGGIGEYTRPKKTQAGYGNESAQGEAPYQTDDVMVLIEFRNPTDIDTETGMVKFDAKRLPFSGVYRVNKVLSQFRDGMFTQRLFLMRVPGQAHTDPAKNNATKTASGGNSYEFLAEVPLFGNIGASA